jgi:curved DNA-binding protein CbpA
MGGVAEMTARPAGIVDYYAVMNLPYDADLTGVENAYARLSDELAALGKVDTGANTALTKLNEAYGVLSRPERRRKYDEVFLVDYHRQKANEERRSYRRASLMQWAIVGAVVMVLAVQTVALAYIGREDLSDLLSSIF